MSTVSDVFGVAWRVTLIALAATKVMESLRGHFAMSMTSTLAIVVSITLGAILLRAWLRKPRDKEMCSTCGAFSHNISAALGPRIDLLLRAEALVAGVLVLLAWCDHAEIATGHAHVWAAAIGVATVTVAAGILTVDRCKACGVATMVVRRKRT
jgi:cyanate permease